VRTRQPTPLVLALALAALLTACSGAGEAKTPPPATTVAPPSVKHSQAPAAQAATTTTAPPAWVLGAHPLPRRPDGFGEVRPTPAALRDRRRSTVDRLPPPSGGFHATIGPITPAIRARMGTTWAPGCPVPLAQLRYVTVSFWGFDGRPHTGELVLNARVAEDVAGAFARIYAARFPIEEMRLPTSADLDAAPTGDGDDTAAFTCRAARKQTRWSAHAYGLAVDIDPFQNPYSRGDLVLPELASAYLDRSHPWPGIIRSGDAVTRAFAAVGWTWGGTWRRPVDRMHFSATGD
jgi:D-alanyl-D-alanine carboxypeptidase